MAAWQSSFESAATFHWSFTAGQERQEGQGSQEGQAAPLGGPVKFLRSIDEKH